MNNPFIVGDKVYLRAVEPGDAATMRGWFNDRDIRRMTIHYRPLNLPSEEALIAKMSASSSDVFFAVMLRQGDRLVGATGLHRIEPKDAHAEFGIAIGDKGEWRKGLASEVTQLIAAYGFETLNLNRIWLSVYEDNVAGVRAYEKAGYRREGLLRQHKFREGRYYDLMLMGLLRDEWRARLAGGGAVLTTEG